MPTSSVFPFTNILWLTADDKTIETAGSNGIDIHKLIIGLMVIFFLGDEPSLHTLLICI